MGKYSLLSDPPAGINREGLERVVGEYLEGERTLFQKGGYHLNQGFAVFPIRNDEIELERGDGRIFNKVTEQTARDLSGSEYCTNKVAILAFLDEVERARAAGVPEPFGGDRYMQESALMHGGLLTPKPGKS
jgi:hypothetical protein